MKKFVLGITLVLTALFMSACNLSDTFLNSQNSKNNPTDSALSSDITSNQNTESTVNSANANNDIDIAEKNINIDVKPTNDGLLCAFITNNNDFVVDELEVQINYFDKKGNIIDLAEDGHDMILPNATVVSRMEAPKDYDHFETEVSVELGIYPYYENHSENVDLSYNIGDDCVIVQITNNADITIDEIEYVVILYKNDEIVTVDHEKDVYDVPSKKTITEKVSTYGEDYDNVKVYLNQAHTFS